MPEEAVLKEEGLLYWRAFMTLKGDRPMGALGGAGRIPWSSINAYALRYGIDGEDFEHLVHMIDAMDDVFLGWLAERQEKGKTAS